MEKYKKLPKKFKAKWIAALRSGEYKQTKERLFDGEGYCCLGVAGVICGITKDKLSNFEVFPLDTKRIPSSICQGAAENDIVAELTEMNDCEGATFLEIADWIEENL